jgi:methionyl-tRNA formyltransferase
MLKCLVEADFIPSLVVEETSPLAETAQRNQLRELNQVHGFLDPPDTSLYCSDHGIPYMTTDDHNSDELDQTLREGGFDIIVLGDTHILRPQIMKRAKHGVMNVHPGVLPQVRGNHPYVWAVIHGLPQGASVHLINEKADRGPVILVRELTLSENASYPMLIFALNQLCGELVVEALQKIGNGTAVAVPQPADGRLTFRAASSEIKWIAAEMLRQRAARIAKQKQMTICG